MSSVESPTVRRRLLTTRILLLCAAFATLQTMLSAAVSSFAPAIAAVLPPVYALFAGVHSIMPLLARLLTGTPWTATITAAVAGALMWPVSAVGPLILLVFLTGAVSFDLVLRGGTPLRMPRLLAAVTASAVALFLVSLPVFSAVHLSVGMLAATLGARLVAQAAAVVIARALERTLRRVGVRGG